MSNYDAFVIRVHTPTGIVSFEEANGYSLAAIGTRDLPERGPLRLWILNERYEPTKLVALFAPGGWFGLDFAGSPAAREIGFVPPQRPTS
jgi:hypothetical protein